MTRRTAKRSSMPEPDGPAVWSPDMVWDRVLSPTAGAKKGARRRDPLDRAFEKGRLAGGKGYPATDRFNAGARYREIFLTAQATGRDSTQALEASHTGGNGLPLSAQQEGAISVLARLHDRMKPEDGRIVRMVCGEAHEPVAAIKAVHGDDYTHSVAARFREALDALCRALEMRCDDR